VEQRPAPSAPPAFSPLPVPPTAQPGARLPYSEFTQAIENMRFDEVREPRSVLPDAPPAQDPTPEFVLRREPGPQPRLDLSGPPLTVEAPPAGAFEPLRLPVPDTHGGFPAGAVLDEPASMAAIGDLRVLGQIHESFIIAAGRDGLWIVDQHVAHERILFEKVLAQQAAGRVEQQRLLMPLVLQLTPAQEVEYGRIAGDLLASGFETEPFGHRTIAVKAVPSGLAAGDVEKAVLEILEVAEHELRRVSVDDLRRGIAASVACRAAIKINTPLDAAKMEWLLRELGRTRCPMSCPHGRPVALRYSTRDILRAFHRI
jgi:DNA mismatch repair protein MutL